MPLNERRANARRRAWGRGPMILRFEPLEERRLLAAKATLPDLVMTSFSTEANRDWGQVFDAVGTVTNQGGSATTSDFKIDLFASANPQIGPGAVYVGSIDMPPGLAPGSSANFDQQFTMPGSPPPGIDPTAANPTVFIDLRINHAHTVVETNYTNDQNQGLGLDTSEVTITPIVPADLVGTAINVSPNSVNWGGTFSVTAQIANQGAGDAPATRARLVLTPAGLTPGGPSDFTIDDGIPVPSIAAFQTINLVRNVTLPATPPSSLAFTTTTTGSTGTTTPNTDFILTLIQDSDYLTNQLLATPAQGLGLDQAQIAIGPGSVTYNANQSLPDLAPTGISLPSTTVFWGQTIQVTTGVQNVGQADAGPFRVRFELGGINATTSGTIFLADALVPGLKQGYTIPITQTIKMPSRLPSGVVVSGSTTGRIIVVVDPEHVVDQSFRSNNTSASAPLYLKLPGTSNTANVPTTPTTGTTTPTTVTTLTTATTTRAQALANARAKARAAAAKYKRESTFKKVGSKISDFFKKLGKQLKL